ncbi:MAG: hypothetical protein M3081_14305 [Gemmatimonadota bacterium]|nr:hypothetical protein [Gemmatimonadota bacterium]
MARAGRVVIVTAGLVATGGVVGAICAIVALAIGFAVINSGAGGDLAVFEFVGAIGAFVGTIMAPLLAWGLLRYVPIGRAIAQCALGTMIGGFTAFALHVHDTVFGPTLGALSGFIVAAVRLRIVTPRARLQA